MKREELQNKILYDTRFFCNNFLQIREYDSPRLIPFIFNEAQEIVYREILKDRAARKPVRHIVLKARKEGVTTLYTGVYYHKSATNKLTDSLLVAHDDETSTLIFDNYRRYYDLCPLDADGISIKPLRKHMNRKEIRFENPTRDEEIKRNNPGLLSSITVKTAGAKEFARGGTWTCFHGSEVAFWSKEANKQMLGVHNSMPDHDPRTMMVLESTANGPSGYFYDQVMKAYKTPEKSGWKLIFLPWYIFEKYRLPLDPGENLVPYDKDEEQLIAKGIQPDQLKWRRWCIKHKCDGDINFFRQEYPATVEEAFIYTGRTVFNQDRLLVFLNSPKLDSYQLYSVDTEAQVCELDEDGDIKVFDEPKPLIQYVIGCDVSEGIDIAENYSNPDTDWTWVSVFRRDNMKQCLSWRIKLDPDLVGPVLEVIGLWYNLAWINVEFNNHGIVVVSHLKKNYPMYRLYTRVVVDQLTDRPTEFVGFKTTGATKGELIVRAKALIRDPDECYIFDKEMIHELQAYRQDSKGRYSGDGCHDDGVISFALANYVRIYSYEKTEKDDKVTQEYSTEEIIKNDPARILRVPRKRKPKYRKIFLGNHRAEK